MMSASGSFGSGSAASGGGTMIKGDPGTNPVESDPLTSTDPLTFGDPLTFPSTLHPAGSTHAEHKLSYRPPYGGGEGIYVLGTPPRYGLRLRK